MAAITIKDMSVSYNKGKSYVLDKLNLEVKDGEFCVFLGPSGCGKSTAMHCVAGLLEPIDGEIRFGYPALAGMQYHRAAAVFKRLPELDRTVRQLEKDVKNLKNE